MRKIFYFIAALCLFVSNNTVAQCSQECNPNAGLYSTNDPADIAYDNMGSSFHSTFVRQGNGEWEAWGANIGISVDPVTINSTTYPHLTGTIYKAAIASIGRETQMVVLTSTGLSAIGHSDIILPGVITAPAGGVVRPLNIDGEADGMPHGVQPEDVKMLFASSHLLVLTTCIGDVYVIAIGRPYSLGVGASGGPISPKWYRVMENATTPLNKVIVARGSGSNCYALKEDGTLWTWGEETYLGDGTGQQARSYATKMAVPIPGLKIKMIQGTCYSTTLQNQESTYYILGIDGKVYSLGSNSYAQLGIHNDTLSESTSWVNALATDGSVIKDAHWISSNEHDLIFPGLSIIRDRGLFYTGGNNSFWMVGREYELYHNHLDVPNGITYFDVITHCETGGHSTMVLKQGTPYYGYVGHKVSGSFGDGAPSTWDGDKIHAFEFPHEHEANICRQCGKPELTSNSPVCKGQDAEFTLYGNPGDIISYQLNGGATQTVTLDENGTAVITVTSPTSDQTIALTYDDGGKECSGPLDMSATVTIVASIVPIFNIPTILCSDDLPYHLPSPSNNPTPIPGLWIPADVTESGTYTFYPAEGYCAKGFQIKIEVAQSYTPEFSFPTILCKEQDYPPLPNHPDNYPDLGHWEHNGGTVDHISDSGVYCFVFDALSGPCIHNYCVTITIVNSPITPTFEFLSSEMTFCLGETPPILPDISLEGIPGTWEPAVIDTTTEGGTNYCFTPDKGYCAEKVCIKVTVIAPITPIFSFPTVLCEETPFPVLPNHPDNSAYTGHWNPAIVTGPGDYCFEFDMISGPCAPGVCVTISVTDTVIDPTFEGFPLTQPICVGATAPALPTLSGEGVSGYWVPSATIDTSIEGTFTYCFKPYEGNCANTVCFDIHIGCEPVDIPDNFFCFGFDPVDIPSYPGEQMAYVTYSPPLASTFGLTFDWYVRFFDHSLGHYMGPNPTFYANCADKMVMAFAVTISNGVSTPVSYYAPRSPLVSPSYEIPGYGPASDLTCFHHTACEDGATGGYKTPVTGIIIAPNPTKSTVAFTGADLDKCTIILYDILGKEIIRKTGLGYEMNMERLASGVYIYKIDKEDTMIQTGKIIKE